jgi:hypothetical protein
MGLPVSAQWMLLVLGGFVCCAFMLLLNSSSLLTVSGDGCRVDSSSIKMGMVDSHQR